MRYKCQSPKHKYDQLGMSEDICDDISLAHNSGPDLDSAIRWDDDAAYVTVENGMPFVVKRVLDNYFNQVSIVEAL